MEWQQIRERYPAQWLVVEAIVAHTEANKRIVNQMAVVDSFTNSRSALNSYIELHERAPEKELYVVHTDRETLDIIQQRWLGIRGRA